MSVDVAIIGAGPYGLSTAAHLAKSKLTFRIFGTPMQNWRFNMPKGMLLKSEGFASNLYDPDSEFTLAHYCKEKNLPYEYIGLPVPLEVFTAYGQEFQKRLVPTLEQTDITSVSRIPGGFELQTKDGQTVHAREVIVATGISHLSHIPRVLRNLPNSVLTHSSQHHDLSGFKGKRVVVVGAGASAVDVAAILNEEGAKVDLVTRRKEVAFHSKAQEPRPLHQRIRHPRSGLGIGWGSRLCTDAPLLFYRMPQGFRFRTVHNHLGPAPGWFVRDKMVGKVPMHVSCNVDAARFENGEVHITIGNKKDGTTFDMVCDHVIAATGYHISVDRLKFLDESLRSQIRTVEDSPFLTTNFETSVPGLYMIGLSSANSFGPVARFAFGAGFTSKRISKHVIAKARKAAPMPQRSEAVSYATTE
jgi:thioredoxin reductase